MDHFWAGFEKRAVSLTGMMGGLRSGLKGFAAPGQIGKAIAPKSGVSIAPRTVPTPLPTASKIAPKNNMMPKPSAAMPAMPKIPKPAKQSARGVSSTNI